MIYLLKLKIQYIITLTTVIMTYQKVYEIFVLNIYLKDLGLIKYLGLNYMSLPVKNYLIL